MSDEEALKKFKMYDEKRLKRDKVLEAEEYANDPNNDDDYWIKQNTEKFK